jgi:hypothetical protein
MKTYRMPSSLLNITTIVSIIILLGGVSPLSAQTTINDYTVWGSPDDDPVQTFVQDQGNNLTVNDTLIIYGNLELKNDADITINTGGVLIIVGNFDAKNKINLAVGGVIVVTGNFSKNGNQGDIIDEGGDVYLFDDDPDWGGDLPDIDYGDEDDIINDPIIDIIADIINSGCSLVLTLDEIVGVSTAGGNDGAIYITVTGTVTSYLWTTSDGSGLVSTDEDQTGLSEGTYSVRVQGGTCSVFGSYTVSEALCTPPTITSTTPGSRCGEGSVTLEATSSAGTISWYDVETGGTPLGTGTSFTTPSISTTTTYYVDATDAGCTTPTRTSVLATVIPVPTATVSLSPAGPQCEGTDITIDIDFTGTNPYEFRIRRYFVDETSAEIEQIIDDSGTVFTHSSELQYSYQFDNLTWYDNGVRPAETTEYHYTLIDFTDSNGCPGTITPAPINIWKIPETGPQYHISNTFGE